MTGGCHVPAAIFNGADAWIAVVCTCDALVVSGANDALNALECWGICLQPDLFIDQCCVVQVRDALLKNIKRRMTPQPLKIRADVELTCFQYDGIEHIKSAIR